MLYMRYCDKIGMKYEPSKYRRRSIRLKGYDYGACGYYFVTICTFKRQCLLGEVMDGQTVGADRRVCPDSVPDLGVCPDWSSRSMPHAHVCLNEVGRIVQRWWHELPNKFLVIETDAHVVMPNHFHGIIRIVGADRRVCPDSVAEVCMRPDSGARAGAPLPKIVQWFKTMTANEYIRSAPEQSATTFSSKLWQRNYYEHVIRSDKALNAIRNYIEANRSWSAGDPENPDCRVLERPSHEP